MDTNPTALVRLVSIGILLAAVIASYVVAMHLRPGSSASASIDSGCVGICISSGGAGQSGSPVGTGGAGVSR